MKPIPVISIAIGIAASCPGSPTDDAILAAMNLSQRPNYSWISTVNDDVRSYEIEGKQVSHGWTWLRLPMVRAIAKRLGRGAGNEIEAVFRDPDTFVIHTEEGWRLLQELPKRHRDWYASEVWVYSIPTTAAFGTNGMGGIEDPHDPFDRDPFPVIIRRIPLPESTHGYSNAQFALTRPHDELAIIVSSATDMNIDGSLVSGNLSELGARLLLVHEGQEQIEPVAAAGAFKLYNRNGLVSRYLLRLEGVLLLDRKPVVVRQTSDTVITNVGTTKFEVPEEVRRKLGGDHAEGSG